MSGTLPNWLADWFGIEPGTAGDAATWRLDVAWPWPPWATVLLVLAAVAWVNLVYLRETSSAGQWYRALLASLRLAAVAILLLMLSEAALLLERTGPPALAVVVDRSASMGLADRYDDDSLQRQLREQASQAGLGEPTRLNQAKLLLSSRDAKLLEHLSANYRLSFYLAAEGLERVPADDAAELSATIQRLSSAGPGSQASRLGDAIRQALDDARAAPPAGVLLLSDGVVTAGASLAEAAEEARRRGVPILAVGLGSDRLPRDVELAEVLVDEAVFVDDLVSFTVRFRSTGLAGETARIVLHRDGEPAPLAEQAVTLGPDGEIQTVLLTYRPTKPGDVPLVVEITPRDDETNKDNNRQRRVVSVRDEPIRVLLVGGYPNYEFRFLKTLLERDRTVELSSYLQDADPDYADQDRTALRALPTSRDELFRFDVIVWSDVDPRPVPRSLWSSARDFVVEKGAGIVFVAGPRYLPWLYRDVPEVAALLPIDLDAVGGSGGSLPEDVARGFALRPTPLGNRAPPLQLGDTPADSAQIWRNLAPLYWLVEVDRLKPAAQVWAEHPTHSTSHGRRLPVLVSQFVGAGKVLFHATDSTWRWRIGAGDAFFARYWVQTVRYLARGKLTAGRGAELSTDRREYRRGEEVEVRLRFLDQRLAPAGDTVSVLVDTPGEARSRVALRRDPSFASVFAGSLSGLADGQYELLVADLQLPGNPPSARFTVVAPTGELGRTAMDRAALASAAEATHGAFYTIADADRLADELPRGRRVPIESRPPLEIWNQWWLLATFVGLVTSEWILRKRKGML
jgi:hypothetical protein